MHVWVFNQWYGQVQGCQGVSWIYSLMRENSIPILLIHSLLFFPSRTNIDFPFSHFGCVYFFLILSFLFHFHNQRFSQRRLNSKQWHKLKWWTSNNVRLLFVEMFNELCKLKRRRKFLKDWIVTTASDVIQVLLLSNETIHDITPFGVLRAQTSDLCLRHHFN